jgi:hypothetical protein
MILVLCASKLDIYTRSVAITVLHAGSLLFIYVARNEDWVLRQKEDWGYVSIMARFFQKWIRNTFNLKVTIHADILPVIPGRIFDRMSVSYLARDHSTRGKSIYHFYLAYFKPFWTDCQTEGYSSDNFGMVYWDRPKGSLSHPERIRYFADKNCIKISHLISHEIMRMMGKPRRVYFDAIHDLWQKHMEGIIPFLRFNEGFDSVSMGDSYHFATVDLRKISAV